MSATCMLLPDTRDIDEIVQYVIANFKRVEG